MLFITEIAYNWEGHTIVIADETRNSRRDKFHWTKEGSKGFLSRVVGLHRGSGFDFSEVQTVINLNVACSKDS